MPVLAIDPASRQTAWQQVTDAIRAAIGSGMLAAGDPLPSVREMSALQDVPVATLQHALGVLADEGSSSFARAVPRLWLVSSARSGAWGGLRAACA